MAKSKAKRIEKVDLSINADIGMKERTYISYKIMFPRKAHRISNSTTKAASGRLSRHWTFSLAPHGDRVCALLP